MWYLNPIKPINQTARNGAGDRQNQLTKPTGIVGLCIIASKLAIYCVPAHLKFLHLKAEKRCANQPKGAVYVSTITSRSRGTIPNRSGFGIGYNSA